MQHFKVLIGYDGSDHAEAAIADLARAGLPDGTEAFVATVSEMWIRLPLSYGGVETSYVDPTITGESQARETAERGADKIREIFPSWKVDYGAAVGSPASVILSKAEEWKPDLTVVGSQSRGTIGRFFLGSAAQSLVTNAACSVRVSRKNERQNSEVRLVIGVDGSGHSSAAIDAVIGRYEKRDCHVRVVSATDLRSYPSITSFDLVEPATEAQILVQQQEIKRAEDAAAKAASELEEAGFSVSCIIENEDPRELIVRQAKEWNADCVFVGARGINRIERILLGSVSSYVAARAECSVEIVR